MIEMLLTEQQVSERLQVSLSTLRHWRCDETGPQAIKIGRLVRYPEANLRAYLDACPQVGGELNAANGPNEEAN
jgi:predicted DNA-binding transcriptional regulator AlpA